VAGLASFLVRERAAAAPMLPLAVFRARQFTATNAAGFRTAVLIAAGLVPPCGGLGTQLW
jgi:hypothetical protein